MNFRYKNINVQKECEDKRYSTRKFSKDIYNGVQEILTLLYVYDNMEKLSVTFGNTYNVHPLKGKRQGEWAISINKQYRLIFKPLNIDGEIENIREMREIVSIQIEGVSKHYE